MSQSDPTLNCEPERERILSKVLMNFGEMRLEKTKNSSRKNPNFLIFSLSLTLFLCVSVGLRGNSTSVRSLMTRRK